MRQTRITQPAPGPIPGATLTTEKMNAQHSNNYTIGYDPIITLAITNGIYKRRAKAESRARRIQAFKTFITRIITLNLRKP